MRKILAASVLFLLAFTLAGCGAALPTGNSPQSDGGSGSSNPLRSARTSTPLTPESKLALGTMKLEGTQLSVDAPMAAKLIPLWQLMVQLHSSSAAAPQEVSAVMDAIRATMKADQLHAIDGMQLTSADLFTVFQGANQAGAGGSSGTSGGPTSSSQNRGNGGFFFVEGPGGSFGGPGGGPGGGGFASEASRGSGTNAGSQTSSSLTAAQAAQARENAVSTLVIGELIRLLQTKVGQR